MTAVRIYTPGLDATQAWERSAEASPPSKGRQRAIDRHDEITRGAMPRAGSDPPATKD